MIEMVRKIGNGVLTDRCARWWDEMGVSDAHTTFGAEGNPTGNPIGGGKGYSDILEGGDVTVRTYEELRAALEEAGTGQVIFVPEDTAIDMSGQETLNIPEGVTLGSTRGVASSEGGLIFSDALDTPGLFHTAGDCVRITGLRIRGPYAERERAAHSSNGIETAHFALEIDNCEISAFAVAATRFILGASRGYVHHNYIHHNQLGGLGYGVSIGGASVLVEGNLFDWCRHHIASSGAPGSAYEARYNICGENANGHLFDMHGGRDRGDATDIAGDWMDIHHNTFMAQDVRSVGIRGIPSQGTQIHHNWFYSSDPENIVRASGKTRVFQNVLGADRTLVEEVEVTV